jgi:hypothetical protein
MIGGKRRMVSTYGLSSNHLITAWPNSHRPRTSDLLAADELILSSLARSLQSIWHEGLLRPVQDGLPLVVRGVSGSPHPLEDFPKLFFHRYKTLILQVYQGHFIISPHLNSTNDPDILDNPHFLTFWSFYIMLEGTKVVVGLLITQKRRILWILVISRRDMGEKDSCRFPVFYSTHESLPLINLIQPYLIV